MKITERSRYCLGVLKADLNNYKPIERNIEELEDAQRCISALFAPFTDSAEIRRELEVLRECTENVIRSERANSSAKKVLVNKQQAHDLALMSYSRLIRLIVVVTNTNVTAGRSKPGV